MVSLEQPMRPALIETIGEVNKKSEWELIDTYSVKAGSYFDRSEDSNGIPYDFKAIMIYVKGDTGNISYCQLYLFDNSGGNVEKYGMLIASIQGTPRQWFAHVNVDSVMCYYGQNRYSEANHTNTLEGWPVLAYDRWLKNISRIQLRDMGSGTTFENDITIKLYAIRNN